ncbi:MAG: hypothetical protein HGA95_01795, partial [Caldiserica bacterium]|nr:hypothetical protein [Caldisericota bacterium]
MPIISLIFSVLLSAMTLFSAFGVKADPPDELKQFDVPTVRMFMVSIENVENG